MNHWGLICICTYTINSLHTAHSPGNLTRHRPPSQLCSACHLQGSPLTCCSWGRNSPMPQAAHSCSPCMGTMYPVPSPPPHRMVLRAGPKPYSYDNGTQHIAWRATGIHPRPAASNELTNKCYIHTPLADNPENQRSRQSRPPSLKKI